MIPKLKDFIFYSLQITLRLRAGARFRFLHGGALNAFLKRNWSVGGKIPNGIIPLPVESGKVIYRPDDLYNFGLVFAGYDSTKIIKMINQIGGSDNQDDGLPNGVLDGGASLFLVTDLNTGIKNPTAKELKPITIDDLKNDVDTFSKTQNWTLRFVTPLRVERKAPKNGHRFFDHSGFNSSHFLRILYGRIFDLAKFAGLNVGQFAPPDPLSWEITRNALLWMDMPLKEKILGGCCGEVDICGLPANWARLLVLGQYLHAGKNTRFGMGAYRITQLNNDRVFPKRAQSIFQTSFLPENIKKAFAKLEKDRRLSHPNEHEKIFFDTFSSQRFSEEYLKGKPQAKPLKGIILNQNGKKRPLAIPDIKERCAQRAVHEVLSPAIDQLLENSSYAYRKGFSRQSASRIIRQLHEQGYKWVLKSDIEHFFDEVSWDKLNSKLIALYDNDPVVGQLMDWVKRSVKFQGKVIHRSKGLPQGAVISPLLSNLFLDEFDESLQNHSLKLIRFADDFLVLCKTKRKAEAALEKAKKAIEDLGLSLHKGKTKIVNFDQGFSYLGYLFCNSLVLEKKKEYTEAPFIQAQQSAPMPLAFIDEPIINRLDQNIWAHINEDVIDHRILLVVSGYQKGLHQQEGRLVIRTLEGKEDQIPWNKISAISCMGKVRISPTVIHACCRKNIPIMISDYHGNLRGMLTSPDLTNPRTITDQALFSLDEKRCLDFAKQIIAAKIHHQNHIIRRQTETLRRELTILERRCQSAGSFNTLLGLEGAAAADYFKHFEQWIQPFRFSSRSRRPAKDPVNVLLNFGYSLLYRQIAQSLVSTGLIPSIGFLHKPRDSFAALAADLMEEFRFLVDGVVIAMIKRKQIKPDDFSYPEKGRYPCLLSHNARDYFLNTFEKRLTDEVVQFGLAGKSYRIWMEYQAKQIKQLVSRRIDIYQPIRIR